jgi:hypothetical protein
MKLPINRKDVLWSAGLLLSAFLFYWFSGLIFPFLVHHAPGALLPYIGFVLGALFFTAIGAGIGALLKRMSLGALVGLILYGLVMLLLALPSKPR